MKQKALQTLEYYKIIELLTLCAVSRMGKNKATALEPLTNLQEIQQAQQETAEALSLILRKGSIPLGGIRDIGASIQRAAAGGMLSIEELLHVGDFLYVCGKIQEYGRADERQNPQNDLYQSTETLQPLFDGVITVETLENELKRCILNSQELADSASAELASIRRNIRSANDRIRDHLNKVIQSAEYKNMLQDPIVTIRNDRYCVPVKSEYRASFQGMIHDQSASGATLFIEPASVVQLNNKIKELFFAERKEIERILFKLTGFVANNAEILTANTEILTKLDFIFAKGELALHMNATRPIFNLDGYVNIKKGRHPLIAADKVVPTDIYLGKDFTTLLITGPNTGGKTVSLKTLGLLNLMGQAGLHIPAFDNSELAIFSNVFADIGDEQSIEQSLSTFSSHMKNIVDIIAILANLPDNPQENSLVLLDELGAGTDPTEGAALAIAILQYLHDRQIRTVVTTHYSELKVYAISTPNVENASCEFNVETLQPTYKLLIGIPGKSNAFAISSRLGLPDHIIAHAKNALTNENIRFEDMITDLEISKKTVLLEKDRAEQYRREAETLRLNLEKQQEKLKNQREKILADARTEALQMLKNTKKQSDQMYKNFQRELRNAASQRDLDTSRQAANDNIAAMHQNLGLDNVSEKDEKDLQPLPENVKIGDKVFVHSLSQTGTLVTLPDSTATATVQVGIMKIKISTKDLSLDKTAQKSSKPKIPQPTVSTGVKSGKAKFISPEIDLRGMLAQEGTERAEKYLDDAYLASLARVTLIHGKGTGVLRTAIHAKLKKHPYVKGFRLGTFGEGEDGVTIVELL
ncbi:MAG: endonuclease MutS2 [Defluviitaleaceae bacterium]|nr:endonuclease MutS2 [Defluviitaleaceae bacterium]